MADKKINFTKKGAIEKWAKIIKEMGERPPPQSLIDKLVEAGKKESKKN